VGTIFKVLGYIWSVIRALIFIGIAIGCLEVAENRFEKIVVALLVLLYIELTSQFMTWGRAIAELTVIVQNNVVEIRKLLNDARVFDYIPEDNDIAKSLANSNYKVVIQMVANAVVYLLILYMLFRTL
jgi:hypothetical protein